MNPNLEMLKLLDHFFKALDGFIDDYGVYLYLAFVWLSLLALGWILSGVCGGSSRMDILPQSFPPSSSWRNHRGNRKHQSLIALASQRGCPTRR
jgi:hypothetical protein